MPKEIVIRLRDGTEFRHPGPVIDFVVQGLREGHLGDGPIWSALVGIQTRSLFHSIPALAINSSR